MNIQYSSIEMPFNKTLINHAFSSCLAQKTCLNMASNIGLPYAAATKLDFI